MKQCPACKNTYTDDSLSFCLTDGSSLVAFSINDESPTQVIPAGLNPSSKATNPNTFNQQPIRVNFGQETKSEPELQTYVQAQPPTKKANLNLIIGLTIGITLSVLLGGIIFAALLMNRGSGNDEIVSNTKTNSSQNDSNSQKNIAVVNNTPDETEKLKDKIANLEKQMQQQKDTKKPNVPIIANPQSNKVMAKANSPGDGFLALRTQPSAETGDRILQIPHGSTLAVLSCLAKEAGKKGRWCRVDYEGNTGWAYDGFMTYQK